MFFHDAAGILILILTGSFLLFVPLATAGIGVWVTGKIKTLVMEGHLASARLRGMTTQRHEGHKGVS
ncbi:MAG TPA: hypothetical protein VGK99_13910 [Acidobacteriota bacterium]|jgi:hypothetical protein